MNTRSTDQSNQELPDDILAQAITSMQGETIPSGPPPQLIAATLRALRETGHPQSRSILFIPRTKTMKFVTTAAGLLITVGLATLLALSFQTPASAFGQAIKQVREARSISYVDLMTVKGQEDPIRTRVFIAEDGRQRHEMLGMGGAHVTISDASGNRRLTLIEDLKLAIVNDQTKGEPRENAGRDFLEWLQALKNLGDRPDKVLGQKELEGKRVSGFVATQGNYTFTMWVDQAIGQPVRIEYDSPVNGSDYHVAMTDLRFDARVDESLFRLDVPAGYKVQQSAPVPAVPGGETSIIEALRGYTKRDGGKFPHSLSDWGPWCVLFSKDSRDGTVDPETTRVMAHLGSILPFLVSMAKTDYAYLGAGKTVAQKDAIVFWYKKPDGTYRAIFGDLSVRDIPVEKLPKQ